MKISTHPMSTDFLARLTRLEVEMESVRDWREELMTRTRDIDERVRKLEKYIWIAFGGLAVLQLVVPILVERLR